MQFFAKKLSTSALSATYTVLTDVRRVGGVMGDARTSGYTIGFRAVTLVDGMTSDWVRIHWDALEKISTCIVNEEDHINCGV